MAFRQVRIEDAELLYEWSMEAKVRENSLNPDVFSYSNHVNWLKKKLLDNNCFFLIFTEKEQNIGVARLDVNENGIATISYSIDKSFRGSGFGKKIVVEMEAFAKAENILQLIAVVKKENSVSQKIFREREYFEEYKDGVFVFTKTIGG